MIYLDNAATTLRKPPKVAEAIVEALGCAGNSARGAHAGALSAARIIYGAREKLAALFNCPRADHVVFTSNVTEALNTAIAGLIPDGSHVITTELEHNSVLRPLYRLRDERGVALSFLPTDAWGDPVYDALESCLRQDTRALVCTHASNLTGNVVDLVRMGAFARAHGLVWIVDAAQTAGVFDIDMAALGIDAFCFTGHKGLMGPQGTGGLCLREGLAIRPLKVGGSGVQSYSPTQPEQLPAHLEAGTLNAHGIAGLSAALDFIAETGTAAIRAREDALTRRFYEAVRSIPGVRIYGDFRNDHAAIVCLNIGDMDSTEVSDRLFDEYGIATRAGAHCAPKLHEALGTREQGAVRFSFSYFTTEEEITAAVRAVREIAEEQ